MAPKPNHEICSGELHDKANYNKSNLHCVQSKEKHCEKTHVLQHYFSQRLAGTKTSVHRGPPRQSLRTTACACTHSPTAALAVMTVRSRTGCYRHWCQDQAAQESVDAEQHQVDDHGARVLWSGIPLQFARPHVVCSLCLFVNLIRRQKRCMPRPLRESKQTANYVATQVFVLPLRALIAPRRLPERLQSAVCLFFSWLSLLFSICSVALPEEAYKLGEELLASSEIVAYSTTLNVLG